MVDPRIERTKQHVLAAAARLLISEGAKPLTYAALARESTVSRRTIYHHWPTLDAVVAEVLARQLAERFTDLDGLPLRERLTSFVESVRRGMDDPIESAALLTAVHDASRNDVASDLLQTIFRQRLTLFQMHVASISPDNFAQLIGPLFTQRLLFRAPISDDLVAAQITFGMSVLK